MTLNLRKLTLAAAVIAATAGTAHAQIKPGDTFTFDVVGSGSTAAYYTEGPQTAVFGATTTYSAAGINGQDYTITSGETKNSNGSVTDVFTVSTPTNFLTTTTINSMTVTGLQFDIGDANSGSNTVDFTLPIGTFSSAGSATYSGGTIALTTSNTLSNNNSSLAALEGVNAGTTAISGFNVHSFTYSITSTAAPEPSAVALSLSGVLLMVGGSVRRRRARP